MSDEKELKEEIVTEEIDKLADCDGNCAACDQDCFGDMDLEPVHKTWSFANVLQVACKVVALIYFVLGTYEYIASIVGYVESYGEMPSIIEVIYSFFAEIGFNTIIILGVGEVINLINRVKEALVF
ncbi:MAG: hypothetical protein MJ245_05895 [Clostridia bacterium]|nr:hypothetical protein [Clostridia bacterium]